MVRWLVALVLTLSAVSAIAAGAGATKKTGKPPAVDTSLDVYAAPGQRVDIGAGRHLNLRCSGSGAPTVLLDIGQGMTSMSWHKVQPLIAAKRRVCSYDRAGFGFSDPGPLPRTAQAEADDLHALVHAAKLDTPLLLVGHSMASYMVRLYASAHPSDVAGLVLVDPVSETLAQDDPAFAATEAKMSADNADYGKRCADAARKGDLARDTPAAKACVPPPFAGLSQRLSDSIRQRYRGTAYWDAALSEHDADAANIAAVRAAPTTYATLPLIVLAADGTNDWLPPDRRKGADAAYDQGRRRIAALSSHGHIVPVAKSSHNIQDDRPDAIADAVASVAQPIDAHPQKSR